MYFAIHTDQYRRSQEEKDDADMDIIESSVSDLADLEPISKLMNKLPDLNFKICKRVFRMLHRISQYSDSNMMHASNL